MTKSYIKTCFKHFVYDCTWNLLEKCHVKKILYQLPLTKSKSLIEKYYRSKQPCHLLLNYELALSTCFGLV